MEFMGFMAALRTAANRIAKNRWMMLVAGFLFMSTTGAFYSFGVYSQFMKISLNYNQQTVDTMAFFASLYLGIVPGLMNDYLGAWSVILAGSGLNFFGFLMIWLAITNRIPRPQIWQMCFYHAAAGNSAAFISTAVLTTSVKNFSGSKGMVIGLLKGFLGLSGALLTQIYLAIYGNNPSSFALLAAWLPAAVYLLLMVFIRPLPQDRGENETQKLYLFLGAAVVLAAYMMVVNLVQNFEKVSNVDNGIITAFMIVILFLPLIVVFRSDRSPQSSQRGQNEDEETVEEPAGENSEPSLRESSHFVSSHTPLLSEISSEEQTSNNPREEVSCCPIRRDTKLDDILTGLRNQPSRGDDYTILQALLSLDLWILFVALTCGLGSGATVIENMGQIGSSLGYSQLHVTTAVSLLNIWSFIGRVIFGFASELFLQRKGIPRPLFFSAILAILCAGQLIFAFNLPGAFYVGSMVVGMCYGGQWPVMTAMVSEIFGLKFFGTLYNFAILATPLGSYILSVRVAGYLYDREAIKQHARHAIFHKRASSIFVRSTKKSALCYGAQCYRLSFFIMATFSMFACFLSLILTARTRGFYKKQIKICNK